LSDAIEQGGTAMHTKHSSPALRDLCKEGYIQSGMTVIDFGAGNGRNADWLRSNGIRTYAYDPYNGTDCDGWEGVTVEFPTKSTDVLFTMFVLNVLTKNDELDVLKQVRGLAPMQFHTVRNWDLSDMVNKAIMERREPYWSHYNELRYANKSSHPDLEMLNTGFKTSRGFQRLVNLEDHTGFMCIRDVYGYKTFWGVLHRP
jgi:hypothetical protein